MQIHDSPDTHIHVHVEVLKRRNEATRQGWTDSTQRLERRPTFRLVEDCILSRTEVPDGPAGGGGLRVRALDLNEILL